MCGRSWSVRRPPLDAMKLPTARLPGRGLRSRIIWTTALVTALAMAAMIGTVVLVLNAVTRSNVDSKLEDRLVVLSSSVAGRAGPPATRWRARLTDRGQHLALRPPGRQIVGPGAGARPGRRRPTG